MSSPNPQGLRPVCVRVFFKALRFQITSEVRIRYFVTIKSIPFIITLNIKRYESNSLRDIDKQKSRRVHRIYAKCMILAMT